MRAEAPRERILVVIGPIGLGDAIEALPVFELINDFWPQSHLAAGCHSSAQQLTLGMCPHLSECIRIRRGSVKHAWRAVPGFADHVRAMRGFDTVLFLYKRRVSWPLLLAARLAGARVHHRHDYRYRDRRRSVYSVFPARVFNQIVTSEWLQVPLTRLREPRIVLSEDDRQFAEEFFKRHELGHRPTVIVNSLASPMIVGWGIDRYADVANALAARGIDVLVNGGTAAQIREFARVAHRLRDRVFLVQTPSPRMLAAVIARCDLLIGEASGQSWLAATLGKPIVILLGPGDQNYPGLGRGGPPWWPWGARCRFVTKIDWCQTAMRERCTCLHPRRWRRTFRVAMRRVGLWTVVRTGLTSIGLYRRHAALHLRPPCLDAVTVEEIVDVALQQLELGRRVDSVHASPVRA
jgi:ADP-heptose:LPS heptosyltransferase